jgi:putative hydrolase of the HAD superfamily
MVIKAITFDLWGTILDNETKYNEYHTKLSDYIIDKLGLKYFQNMFVENMDKKQFLEDVKILFGEIESKYAEKLLNKQVKTFKIYSDVKYIFELQKKYDIKIGIISNASFRTFELLKNWKDLKKFDSITISYEYETKKPNKEIFEISAKKLKVPLKDIIHIGDNFIDDFDGPKKQKINSILLDRENYYQNEKQKVNSFKELEKYLLENKYL